MFQTLSSPKSKPAYSIVGSLVLEAVVLFVCVYHAPIFVKPSSVAWGQRGISEILVYNAPPQAQLHPPPKKTLPHLKTKPKPIPELRRGLALRLERFIMVQAVGMKQDQRCP
jgi:hypothetical protein